MVVEAPPNTVFAQNIFLNGSIISCFLDPNLKEGIIYLSKEFRILDVSLYEKRSFGGMLGGEWVHQRNIVLWVECKGQESITKKILIRTNELFGDEGEYIGTATNHNCEPAYHLYYSRDDDESQ